MATRSSSDVLVVIPARYGSTRFPGKPLVSLKGKPLVQWVWEAVAKSKRATAAVVATDDVRIFEAVKRFGGKAIMTRVDHPSGTDRMAEVARKIPAQLYVNVQGDEPLISPREIDRLIEGIGSSPMATLAHRIESREEFERPDVVKVALDRLGDAIYFSRAMIPYPRGVDPFARGRESKTSGAFLRHVGIYAFQAGALRQFVRWPQGMLERIESLEQLRALENGMKIRVLETRYRCWGVDTPADLRRVAARMKR